MNGFWQNYMSSAVERPAKRKACYSAAAGRNEKHLGKFFGILFCE
jgi:hypothetical protein